MIVVEKIESVDDSSAPGKHVYHATVVIDGNRFSVNVVTQYDEKLSGYTFDFFEVTREQKRLLTHCEEFRSFMGLISQVRENNWTSFPVTLGGWRSQSRSE